ncbi:MAG TPA: VOC family protein [Alphaproteobacteria bacterium]|jgi:catechol 2,3-dioxygenase-like lactoylglutathione lyase family enzyme
MTRGIDHLVLAVRDLAKARAFYEQLGFTLTPRAEHPWGTANHLVQLNGCFLELLGVSDPAKIAPFRPGEFSFGARNRDFLAEREGMSMLVFQSRDARRDRAEFAAAGLETYAPFDFAREAKLPDGTTARVAFSLAFVTDPRMPEAAFFTCQQHAPRYFWKREFQLHANGARGIAEVVMVAPEPAALAAFFAALQGKESVRGEDGALRVATARGRISVVTPPAFAARFGAASPGPPTPHFAAFRISGVDPAAAAARLGAAGIPHRASDGTLQVPAAAAFGVAVEFAL